MRGARLCRSEDILRLVVFTESNWKPSKVGKDRIIVTFVKRSAGLQSEGWWPEKSVAEERTCGDC